MWAFILVILALIPASWYLYYFLFLFSQLPVLATTVILAWAIEEWEDLSKERRLDLSNKIRFWVWSASCSIMIITMLVNNGLSTSDYSTFFGPFVAIALWLIKIIPKRNDGSIRLLR
jgi:hypothetical protein